MKSYLRLIGDVHGKIEEYLELTHNCERSIQVGDMGFADSYAQLSKSLISRLYHRFVPGNHDDYDHLPPQSLGDFGFAGIEGCGFFFVRGAFSIDKQFRTKRRDWWPEEELTYEELFNAVVSYQTHCPNIVITHDCPTSVSQRVGDPGVLKQFGFADLVTRTQRALEVMWKIHQPKLWVFGHYHRDYRETINGTEFICLPELGTLDLSRKELEHYAREESPSVAP